MIRRPANSSSTLVACALAVCTTLHAHSQSVHPAEASLQSQLHQAISLAEHGDPSHALSLTQALLEAHPNYAPALKFQGALLEDMGRQQQAADSYEQALKLTPNDVELMYKVGVIDLLAGDRDGAIKLLAQRARLVPRDADTLFYLAQAYHLKGDDDLALKTIRACLNADPTNVAVWQKYGELLCSSGDNDTALTWLHKAQQADPTLDRIDFDLGVASYKSMNLDPALEYSSRAVHLHPNDAKALGLLAAVDAKLAHWTDAEPLYKQLLAINPDDTSSLLGLGHSELELKNYQQAADSLERLLQQDPTQVLAHFYLSKAYIALGRKDDAQHEADLHARMLEQASAVAPEGETQTEKAAWRQAKQLLDAGREADAIKLFRERAKGPYATTGEPYVLVGALYLFMGRTDDALRCLNQALKVDPSVRGAHTYLGMLAMQQEDQERAEQEYKAELAADPNYQTAVVELGELRYRQGRWAEAADQLSRSRTTVPAQLYMLCDAYFQLGKVREANLTAELIAAYGKDNPQVFQRTIDLLNRNHQTELSQHLSAKLPR